MTRVAFILSICWFTLMSSCTEAPKAVDSLIKEDVATAQVNTVVKKPTTSIVPEKKTDILPEVEESKPTSTKEIKPIKKKSKEPRATSAPKSTPKTFANIRFDKTVHEFGEIDEGDKITHKFKFKNTGNGPLTIQNVDVSCGCTMPTYPIIPIGPGETGEIGVVYNSKGKFGTQKPSITIKTNATQPIVKLYMSGSIKHVFEKPAADSTQTKG